MMLPSHADEENDDDGRVSVYFKTKSQEMGNMLSGTRETRVIIYICFI